MTSTLIVAHRGATANARENTLEAFEQALELGADMIELDVRKSSDQVLLVHHDGFVVREGKRYQINDIDFQTLGRLVSYRIPSLEEVLVDFGGRIRLDIELKETGYEEYFLHLMLKYLKPDRFVCTSFHDSSVAALKQMNRGVRVGLLLGINDPPKIFNTRLSELFPWKRCVSCGADFLAPHYRLINALFLKLAQIKKVPLFIWTVNRSDLIEKYCKKKVEAIITDRLEQGLAIRDRIAGQ